LDRQLIGFWQDSLNATVFRSVIAEAQTDPVAAEVLANNAAERCASAEVIIDRAKARGEVNAELDAAVVVNLVAGFAWHQLLTDQIASAPSDIETVVNIIVGGIKKPRS